MCTATEADSALFFFFLFCDSLVPICVVRVGTFSLPCILCSLLHTHTPICLVLPNRFR
jgi:hypothetical protein